MFRKILLLAAIGLVGTGIGAVLGFGDLQAPTASASDAPISPAASSSPSPSPSPAAIKPLTPPRPTFDVDLSRCQSKDFGMVEATGTIVNQSTRTLTFMIQVEFIDAQQNRAADATTYVNSLRPGQQAGWDAMSMTDFRWTKCRVADVSVLPW
jgi:hypothetical protein